VSAGGLVKALVKPQLQGGNNIAKQKVGSNTIGSGQSLKASQLQLQAAGT
jgi:hypothetical protein